MESGGGVMMMDIEQQTVTSFQRPVTKTYTVSVPTTAMAAVKSAALSEDIPIHYGRVIEKDRFVFVVKASVERLKQGAKLYSCSECGNENDTTGNLYKHMRVKHSELTIKQLSQGFKAKSKSEDIPIHYGKDIGKDRFVFAVKASVERLKQGAKLYSCSECGDENDTTGNLCKHMHVKHSELTIKQLSHQGFKAKSKSNTNSNNSSNNNNHKKRKRGEDYTVSISSNTDDCFHEEFGNNDNGITECEQPDEMRPSPGLVPNLGTSFTPPIAPDIPSHNTPSMNNGVDHTTSSPRDKVVFVVRTSLEDIQRGKRSYQCSKCGLDADATGSLYKHMERKHKECTVKKLNNKYGIITLVDDNNTVQSLGWESVKDDGERGRGNQQECVRRSGVGDEQNEEAVNNLIDFSNQNTIPYSLSSNNENKSSGLSSGPNHLSENTTNCVKSSDNEKTVTTIRTPRDLVLKGQKMFGCSECDYTSNVSGNVRKHARRRHPIFTHKRIDIPLVRVKNPVTISDKIVTIVKSTPLEVTQGEKPFRCSECGLGKKFTGSLYIHMEDVHSGLTIQPLPGYDSSYLTDKAHRDKNAVNNSGTEDKTVQAVDIYTKAGYRLYKCSLCSYINVEMATVYQHMRKKHKGYDILKRSYAQCIPRPQKLTRETLLSDPSITKTVRAIRVPGEKPRKYKCSQCRIKCFASLGNAYKHMRKVHKGFAIIKKYGKDELNMHGGVDVSEQPEEEEESQDEIDFSNITKTVRVIDVPDAADKKYKCSQCTKLFSTIGNAYKHMRKMHKGYAIIKKLGKNELNMYMGDEVCDDGDGDYGDNVDNANDNIESDPDYKLNESRPVVSGPRRIVQAVDIHHMGNHRYMCSECNRTSLGTGKLYEHMRKAHQGFVIVKRIGGEELNGADEELSHADVTPLCKQEKDQQHDEEQFDLYLSEDESTQEHSESENDSDVYVTDDGEEDITDIEDSGDEDEEDLNLELSDDNEGDKSQTTRGPTRKVIGSQTGQECLCAVTLSGKTVGVIGIPKVGEQSYRCTECGEITDSINSLYKHMKNNHLDFKIVKKTDATSRKYGNDMCVNEEEDEIGDDEDESNDGAHSQEPGNKSGNSDSDEETKTVQVVKIETKAGLCYKCSECDIESVCTGILYRHMRRKHKGFKIIFKDNYYKRLRNSQPNKDALCSSKASKPKSKTVKVIEVTAECRYKCSQCGLTGRWVQSLYRHMRRKHKGFNIVKSSGDGVGENRGADLGNKKTVHTIAIPAGQVQYKCSACNVPAVSDSSLLYKHIKNHHKGHTIIYNDNDEDDDYSDQPRSVGSVISIRSYECCICMETFNSSGDLDQHVKVHEENEDSHSHSTSHNFSIFDYPAAANRFNSTAATADDSTSTNSTTDDTNHSLDKAVVNDNSDSVPNLAESQKVIDVKKSPS